MTALRLLVLMVPLIIGGVLHMIVVKMNLFPFLKIPLNQKLFGQNKTYRGFLVMPLFTLLGIYLAALIPQFHEVSPTGLNLPALGLALGLGYVIFELPNSFLKRRLGIPSGGQAGRGQVFFLILDRVDSAIGCALVYWLFGYSPEVFLVVPLALIIHPLITVPLYLLGIKKELL